MSKLLDAAKNINKNLTKQSAKSEDRAMLEKLNFLFGRGVLSDLDFLDKVLNYFDLYMAGDPEGMKGIDELVEIVDASLGEQEQITMTSSPVVRRIMFPIEVMERNYMEGRGAEASLGYEGNFSYDVSEDSAKLLVNMGLAEWKDDGSQYKNLRIEVTPAGKEFFENLTGRPWGSKGHESFEAVERSKHEKPEEYAERRQKLQEEWEMEEAEGFDAPEEL